MLQYLSSTKSDLNIKPIRSVRKNSWVRSERPTDDEKHL